MKIVYPAKFEADEDGRILVTFRDLPEAATDGATEDEARAEATDLLNSALMFRMKYREDIPAPSRRRKGEELVAPDAAVAMKTLFTIFQSPSIFSRVNKSVNRDPVQLSSSSRTVATDSTISMPTIWDTNSVAGPLLSFQSNSFLMCPASKSAPT